MGNMCMGRKRKSVVRFNRKQLPKIYLCPKCGKQSITIEILKNRESHPNGIIIVLVGKIKPEIERYILKKVHKIHSLTQTKGPIKALLEKKYQVLLLNKGYA